MKVRTSGRSILNSLEMKMKLIGVPWLWVAKDIWGKQNKASSIKRYQQMDVGLVVWFVSSALFLIMIGLELYLSFDIWIWLSFVFWL